MSQQEYISREAALRAMYAQAAECIDLGGEYAKDHDVLIAATFLLNSKSIPAADVVPVHRGEWVEFDGEGTYQCTYCGEPFILLEGTPRDNEYNFCPKCGAYLREVLDGGEHRD